MKILITILLALFISSNAIATDHEWADLPNRIIRNGEVLASGLMENGVMIMIMKYKDSNRFIITYRCRLGVDAVPSCQRLKDD